MLFGKNGLISNIKQQTYSMFQLPNHLCRLSSFFVCCCCCCHCSWLYCKQDAYVMLMCLTLKIPLYTTIPLRWLGSVSKNQIFATPYKHTTSDTLSLCNGGSYSLSLFSGSFLSFCINVLQNFHCTFFCLFSIPFCLLPIRTVFPLFVCARGFVQMHNIWALKVGRCQALDTANN